MCGCLATQLCLTLFGLLCPWNFPGKNTGAGCHFFLQGIFLEGDLPGSNPHLLHLLFSRWIPYLWRQLRSPLQYICGSKHQTVHFKHTQFLFIKKKNHRHPSALSSTGSTQVAESQLPSGGTLPGTTSQEAIARWESKSKHLERDRRQCWGATFTFNSMGPSQALGSPLHSSASPYRTLLLPPSCHYY